MMRWLISLIILLQCILPSGLCRCQDTVKGHDRITFKGNCIITGYLSNRQGTGQEIPAQYLTVNFRGSLNLWGIPFSSSALVSTMQSDAYQSMNYFTFKLDARSMLNIRIKRRSFAFMRHFEVLELGRTRPDYSSLMFRGTALNGINTCVRFGSFFTGVAWGESQRSVSEGFYSAQQYQQRILYGRIGFGHNDRNIFYLHALKAEDAANSLVSQLQFFIRNPDTLIHLTDTFFIPGDTISLARRPQESLMAGLGIGLSFFQKKLRIEGEVAGSLHTSNTRSEALSIDLLPDWFSKIYTPRLTTSLSYAGRLKTALNLKSTRLQATADLASPGFQSPGIPYTRQDYMSIQANGSQMFFKRKLTLQPLYRWYRDNLSGMRATTTTTLIWGITALWRPMRLPYLSLTWSPHHQLVRTSGNTMENTASVITASTGKQYLISKAYHCFTGITWSSQEMEAAFAGIGSHFSGNSILLQQTFMLRKPFSFNASFMLYHQEFSDLILISRQYSIGVQYFRQKKLNAGMGLRYSDRDQSQRRFSLTGNLMTDFGKYGQLKFVAEPVTYRDLSDPSKEFNEYSIRISYIKTW